MRTVPETNAGKIAFYETRLPAWAAHAEAIGIDAETVDRLAALTAAAAAAREEHVRAREAARAAAARYREAVRALHAGPGAGSDTIAAIRNHAERTDDPEVYALALLPRPARLDGRGLPGSLPPPGAPFAFRFELLQSGALVLRWKCRNPAGAAGTIYEIRRRVAAPGVRPGRGAPTDPCEAPAAAERGPFELLGTSGRRRFLDETIPAGASELVYEITAVRSTARGAPARFAIAIGANLGRAGPTREASPAPRAAA